LHASPHFDVVVVHAVYSDVSCALVVSLAGTTSYID